MPKLIAQVRDLIRVRHYSRRTEEAYVYWIKQFIFFHNKRHPVEMGAPEVAAFLSDLAVERQVAASTQNQALAAIPSLSLCFEAPTINRSGSERIYTQFLSLILRLNVDPVATALGTVVSIRL